MLYIVLGSIMMKFRLHQGKCYQNLSYGEISYGGPIVIAEGSCVKDGGGLLIGAKREIPRLGFRFTDFTCFSWTD